MLRSTSSSSSRREFLGGALAAGALLASGKLAGQAAPARAIDCHHHFVSPAFLKVLLSKEGKKTPGFTSFFPLGLWKNYSPAKDIELMDQQGVATSLLSVTSPGVTF